MIKRIAGISLTATMMAGTLFAAQPTPADLDAALKDAQQIWGYTITDPIRIVFELYMIDGREAACPAIGNRDMAITEVKDVETRMTSDEDGSIVSASHTYSYIIKLNPKCDWSKIALFPVMMHEVGHLIIGAKYHSSDPRSIMYRLVSGKGQSIMPADREEMRLAAIRNRGIGQ